MQATKDMPRRLDFDPDKVEHIYDELVNIFKCYKPTVGEILIAYGNLGYTLGASIEGFKETGPALDKLKEMYYKSPTLGVAMMLQAVEVLSWFEQYQKAQAGQKEEPKV